MIKFKISTGLILSFLLLFACSEGTVEVEEIREVKTGNQVTGLLGRQRETETNGVFSYPKINGLKNKKFEAEINRILKENAEKLHVANALESNVHYEVLNLPTASSRYLSIMQTSVTIPEGTTPAFSLLVFNADVKNKKILGNRAEDWGISIGNMYLMNTLIPSIPNRPRRESMEIRRTVSRYEWNAVYFNDLRFGVKNDSIAFIFRSTTGPTYTHHYMVIPYLPADDLMDEASALEFEQFISRFCEDRDFQLSRIKFPAGNRRIPVDGPCPDNDPNYEEGMDGCYKLEPYNKNNWKHISVLHITPFDESGYYGFWYKKTRNAEFISGISFDISYKCTFEKIKGQWYLTKYDNFF